MNPSTAGIRSAILRSYEAFASPLRDVALLRRRARPLRWRVDERGERRFALGEWIDVPRTEGFLFASLDLPLTTLGSARAALFRLSPVHCAVRFDDGKDESWRIVPSTAAAGLLLSPLPRDFVSFYRLLGPPDGGGSLGRAARIAILGSTCELSAGTLRWRVATLARPD
jgi:hypothetical protein